MVHPRRSTARNSFEPLQIRHKLATSPPTRLSSGARRTPLSIYKTISRSRVQCKKIHVCSPHPQVKRHFRTDMLSATQSIASVSAFRRTNGVAKRSAPVRGPVKVRRRPLSADSVRPRAVDVNSFRKETFLLTVTRLSREIGERAHVFDRRFQGWTLSRD